MIPLAVVIPWTRPTAVVAAVTSLLEDDNSSAIQVILVGTAPAPGLPADPRIVELICPVTHAGFRRALAIQQTPADRYGFLDDDTTVCPGWVREALSLDPRGCQVWTGPEFPANDSAFAGSTHRALTTGRVEGHLAHADTGSLVNWFDVPFCNMIVPGRIFNEEGLPSAAAPWDMDDFDYCHRIQSRWQFVNRTGLRIRHDRYPDAPGQLLRYKWRTRVRTGEKVVTHPDIYLRVPAIRQLLLGYAAFLAAVITIGIPAFILAVAVQALLLGRASYKYSLGAQSTLIGAVVQWSTVTAVAAGLLRQAWRSLVRPRFSGHLRNA